MVARYRIRPMTAGFYGLFYTLEGSGEPSEGELDNEPEAEYAETQEFFGTRRLQKRGLERALETVTRESQRGDFFRLDVPVEEPPSELRRDCPVSDQHVTGRWGRKGEYELLDGPRLSAFLTSLPGYTFVPALFKEALENSGFTGLFFTEWSVCVAQTNYTPGKVYFLDSTGHNCTWPAEVVDGPNACGFCGYGPVLCPECGAMLWDCPACGQTVFVGSRQHQGAEDRRILLEPFERQSDWQQIDASKWRGEDFVSNHGCRVVTRRVIDWLRQQGAGPWIAYPVKCELAKVRPEQHSALLTAAGSHRSQLNQALKAIPSTK